MQRHGGGEGGSGARGRLTSQMVKTKPISTGSVMATSPPSKAGPNMPIAELAPTIKLVMNAAARTAMMV
jgi:hypothetical protein